MVTVYHVTDPDAAGRLGGSAPGETLAPGPASLELAAFVCDTNDPAEAFDQVIHRDGEHWTLNPGVTSFGDPRLRRSTQDGDVLVTGDGTAHLVLPLGFRVLPGLRLPFLP